MIHAEQGERVANFRALTWLFSLKTSAIIFNIIHCSCLEAGGVFNDLEKGESIQVCGTPRAGGAWLGETPWGMRGLIVHGMMPSVGESSGTARTGIFSCCLGGKPELAERCSETQALVFSSGTERCGSPALCGSSQGKRRAEGRAAEQMPPGSFSLGLPPPLTPEIFQRKVYL